MGGKSSIKNCDNCNVEEKASRKGAHLWIAKSTELKEDGYMRK